jgi:two-component system chemotaxis response regulator CheY
MNGKSILVIEDDIAVQQTLRDVLEMQGYDVITASNGKEGLDVLRSSEHSPALILLDLMMPNVNGWQFLDSQRNDPNLKDIPVVICSAYMESAKSVRPAAVIPKPIQLNQLLGAIKAYSA